MSKDRTTEKEIRIGVLLVAASLPEGKASTTELKEKMPEFIDLTSSDMELSQTRSEPMYCQIVGNVICHAEGSTSLFTNGYAIRTDDGLSITPAGRALLKNWAIRNDEIYSLARTI